MDIAGSKNCPVYWALDWVGCIQGSQRLPRMTPSNLKDAAQPFFENVSFCFPLGNSISSSQSEPWVQSGELPRQSDNLSCWGRKF